MKSMRKIGLVLTAAVMSLGIVGVIEGPGHADTGWTTSVDR